MGFQIKVFSVKKINRFSDKGHGKNRNGDKKNEVESNTIRYIIIVREKNLLQSCVLA